MALSALIMLEAAARVFPALPVHDHRIMSADNKALLSDKKALLMAD